MKRLRLISTIFVPYGKGERIVKFREYTGNGHIIVDDSLKMTRFPGGYFTPDGGVYYNVTDYQGNVCKVVRSDETVCQTMDYYPYGEPFSEWNWDRAEINSSMSSNRYLFNGNERETGLGVNMYDFNARNYVASYPLFGRPDPKCREFPWLNPYSFCGGDPINNVDPSGQEIHGASKNDVQMVVEDLREIFRGEEFSRFRELIVRSGVKQNGKSIAKISPEARAAAFEGVNLTEDQESLVDMAVNTINSNDKHIIEYVNNPGHTSYKAGKEFALNCDDPDDMIVKTFNYYGYLPGTLVKAHGDGMTVIKGSGSYSVVLRGSDLRALVTGHEVLGHGRSLALGRGEENQHYDAIQTENLIRRVMGITIPNTGEDHKAGGKSGYFPSHSELPGFR